MRVAECRCWRNGVRGISEPSTLARCRCVASGASSTRDIYFCALLRSFFFVKLQKKNASLCNAINCPTL